MKSTNSKLYATLNVSNSPEYKPSQVETAILAVSLASSSRNIGFGPIPKATDNFEDGQPQTYTYNTEADAGESLEEFGARMVYVDIEKLADITDPATTFSLKISVDGIQANGNSRTLGFITENTGAITGDNRFTVEFLEAEPFQSYKVTINVIVLK